MRLDKEWISVSVLQGIDFNNDTCPGFASDNRNQVVSRGHLLKHVWNYDPTTETRSIDVHIRRLRAKLAAGPNPPAIVSVRGFGYKLISDPRRATAAA